MKIEKIEINMVCGRVIISKHPVELQIYKNLCKNLKEGMIFLYNEETIINIKNISYITCEKIEEDE